MARFGLAVKVLGMVLVASFMVPAAQAQEAPAHRYVGYYYPDPGEPEVYKARAQTLPEVNRAFRIGFVTGLAGRAAARPFAAPYVMFAKGGEAHKMIITATRDGPFDTIYRARAVLADLTAMARTLPIFQEYGVEDWFTFLDLLKMMGFQELTVTDGKDFAHQFVIE